MADMSSIVGIALMVVGCVLITTGTILCYVTKGEYYNQDEVQAMVAAEVLEEEKRKKMEAIEAEMAIRDELEEDEEDEAGGMDVKEQNMINAEEDQELGMTNKKRRRGPLMAS